MSATDYTTLAIPQEVHALYGLAQPFWIRRPVDGRDGECQQFVPGCAMGSIRRQECDLQLEYGHYEFLANGRHGLTISEGAGGIYFAALLPDTAFVRQIMAAVRSGPIAHVCVHGETRTRPSGEAGLWNVIEYSLFSINLLIASTTHEPETWVTADQGLHQAWRRKNDRQYLDWLHQKLEPATVAG